MGGCSLAWGATADSATGMKECLELLRRVSCPGNASPQEELAEPGARLCENSIFRK